MTTLKKQTRFMDDCDVDANVASSTRDEFEGRVLIDKLLRYYSKFDGSREKAARYAQKLLDLGHVECLAGGHSFEDTTRAYRWTDANKVVTEARQRAVEPRRNKEGDGVALKDPLRSDEKAGKSILKISIETDSYQNAEIQASIRASPRRSECEGSRVELRAPPKAAITTVEEDSFFGRRITKTLSYLNEDEKNGGNIDRRKTPYITDVSSPSKENQNEKTKANGSDSKSVGEGRSDSSNGLSESEVRDRSVRTSFEMSENNGALSSPRKKPFRRGSSPIEIKQPLTTLAQGHRVPLFSRKSSTENVTTKEGPAPGADVRSMKENDASRDVSNHVTNSDPFKREGNSYSSSDRETFRSPQRSNNPTASTIVASTQTSEKSIMEASMLYGRKDDNNGKRSPSPAPRSFRNRAKQEKSESTNLHQKGSETNSQRIKGTDEDKSQKKTRFSKEISEASSAFEERLNGAIVREQSDALSDREMSLHSTGNADEMPTNHDITNGVDKLSLPASPPPPSPPIKTPTSPNPSPMKALFWTKLSNLEKRHKGFKVFWDELTDDIYVDEEEFEKLFRKPQPSPQTPRLVGQLSENGRMLKVLGMERSRQVSIRASSMRLPVEEIHDAIVDMDDEKLNLDAIQVLCDVKPTSEELDQIADALKTRPNAILDKPEQFILMLAMIPSLDERLKCWRVAKKFPDKIVEIQDQLLSLNDACNQVMESTTLKRVLELILMLGNQMNKGTQRGDAYGYFLDILPKLKDVKAKDGESNLLQYVVKVLRQQMRLEGLLDDQLPTPRGGANCGLPETETLHRAISVSITDLGDELERLAVELRECEDEHMPVVLKESTVPAESETFQSKFKEFLEKATEKLRVQGQLYQDVLLTIEDFQMYYVPNSHAKAKETAFTILRSISDFTDDFRRVWTEAQKEDIKEEFYKIQKYKKERQAEIQVKNTPSALKERFLSRRRRNSPTIKKSSTTPDGKNEYSSYPRGGGNTPVPKRNYRFDDVSSKERDGSNYDQQTRSSATYEDGHFFGDRAAENSFRLERRMQELQARRYGGKS